LSRPSEVHLVEDDTTSDLCNLFDGCYELLVQMLGGLFVHPPAAEHDLQALAKVTESLMLEVIGPLGSILTALPAGPSYPGATAGPSFRLSRAAAIPTHMIPARLLFQERLTELAAYCGYLQSRASSHPGLARIRDSLLRYVQLLEP
jgi:hypothetical protein